MKVMLTPSARSQLLELVAAVRASDRTRAVHLVDAVAARLEALGEGADPGRTLRLHDEPAEADAVRLFYRTRGDVVWVLALFSQTASSSCTLGAG